jgi:uncharacterized protein (TIGR02147 family)
MKTQLPSIYEYIDFKQFLADMYKAKRGREPGFTHAYISHKLGQPNSRSFFNNIIKGRKRLTAVFIEQLITLFDLGVSEGKFFRALVNYDQASGTSEKEFYFEQE